MVRNETINQEGVKDMCWTMNWFGLPSSVIMSSSVVVGVVRAVLNENVRNRDVIS